MLEIAVKYVLLPVLIFAVCYFFLPELLLHILGVGSWKRQYSPGVSLTFDDGPDPKYTPLLLDILAKQQIKACFFLVAEKAEKYPEITKKIENEGHLIGLHGYNHKHAWLMSPQETWESWEKSASIIFAITGKEPEYIRPPWGSFNLSLVLWGIAKKKRFVLWNAIGKDWKERNSAAKIISNILPKIKEGAIVLLHDSGGADGAPEHTLACLAELVSMIKQNSKLPVVPLVFPQWSIYRRLSFRAWEKWEHLYAKIYHVQRIDDNNLFRLAQSRYHGPDLFNEKGELLASKGDIIGEIHFDNIRFQSVGSNLHSAGIRALKQVRLSLPTLARYISCDPAFKNVKVYIGITMLSRGAKGLGFSVQEYPSLRGHLIAFFQKLIMRIYHPAGRKRNMKSLDKPKLVWISKEKLLEKYDEKIIS